MKRKLSLLFVLLLSLAVVLTACNQAKKTELATRWADEESYHYNITLADFKADSGDDMYTFNAYGDDYSKDFRIQAGTILEAAVTDEIRPNAVKGDYYVTIKTADGFTTLATSQVIYAQYKTSVLEKLDNWSALKARIADANENPFDADDKMTTLKSERLVNVKFSTGIEQKPVESQVASNGYYIGKIAQTVSQYIVETKYDLNAKTATVTKKTLESDQGEVVTNSLNVSSGSNFIDVNQLFLYARSLDKAEAFQDSPSVVVYNPVDNTHNTATFELILEQKAILKVDGTDTKVKLNATAIAVSNVGFMMQENLPNLTAKDLDVKQDGTAAYAKHTVVRFRVSSLAYELVDYSSLQSAIKEIVAK